MSKSLWKEGQGCEIENNAKSFWHTGTLYAQFYQHTSRIFPVYPVTIHDADISNRINQYDRYSDIDVTQTRRVNM